MHQDGSGDSLPPSPRRCWRCPTSCPAVICIGRAFTGKSWSVKKGHHPAGRGAWMPPRLVWDDGGKLPHPDGRPTHTFRSYTAFFSGEKLRVEDMTIENDAGPGAKPWGRPSPPMWTAARAAC
ncbi:MAG: hypothetical protein ACLVJH_05515 [Faecalibacterium prausnitzii]